MKCPSLHVDIPVPKTWKEANIKMVENFLRRKYPTFESRYEPLKEASEWINRGIFCPSKKTSAKYKLSPCPLVKDEKRNGYRATLSAFPVHWEAAQMVLDHWATQGLPKDAKTEGIRILDIGSGSGYLLALFGQLLKIMHLQGEMVGVELLPELVEFSQRQLCSYYPTFSISIYQGDGWLGDPTWKKGDRLFDVINVGAASNGLPKVLFEQLSPGGILIIPIECHSGEQFMYTIQKSHTNEPIAVRGIPVRYVPLVPTGGTIKAFEC